MKDFLLEILSEEIPAKMQIPACENFAKITLESFTKAGIKISQDQIKALCSPRRITLYIKNIEEKQIIGAIKKIGPKISADKKAIQGFLKSVDLENESQLKTIEHNQSTCFLFEKAESAVATKNIIAEILPTILQKMTNSWPKLMRYDVENGKNQTKWIRPVRNILCLFGTEIVDFEFFALKSNNKSFGHFLHNQEPIEISSPEKYEEILRDNFVIVDQNERKKEIISQIEKITTFHGLKAIDDENSALLDEVNGLCEWPNALLGTIDQKFMDLPREVLILTLKLNQKYFCLENNAILSQNFIFISNAINIKKNSAQIIKDNEKISRARLEDAEFFIEEDLKTPLINRVDNLKNIIFHQKLGSVFEKCERIESLAEFISIWIAHCDISKVERAATLCKADLVTKAVIEFPELQGKMGSFYAQKQNENQKISAAIYEHYLPLGPNSGLPQTPLGIALALADKIDSIVGLFLAGEKPTSSKDPFALRRSALGVIRICITHNIAIPFNVLINKSLNVYKPKLLEKLLNESQKDIKTSIKRKQLTEEIVKFFIERLKNFLKDNHKIRTDVLNVVIDDYASNLDSHKYGDMINLAKKTSFVNQLIENKENHGLLTLYKRSANVLAIEEKKSNHEFSGKPHRLALKLAQEKLLYKIITKIEPNFKKMVKKGKYEEAFQLLRMLEIPLTNFFDKVIVNDQNKKLRENRLLILAKIRSLFLTVADLSKIEF